MSNDLPYYDCCRVCGATGVDYVCDGECREILEDEQLSEIRAELMNDWIITGHDPADASAFASQALREREEP